MKKAPIVPMQQESFDNILEKVEDVYRDNFNMNRVKDEFFIDTKEMYFQSMQKSILENTILTPNVKGIDDEKIGTPPKELEYIIEPIISLYHLIKIIIILF